MAKKRFNIFYPSPLFLFVDPGSGMGENRIRAKYPGSATLIEYSPTALSELKPGIAPEILGKMKKVLGP
jgi:hypothetical protein